MQARPAILEKRLERTLRNAEDFFMKTGRVYEAARTIAQRLDAANIPYAIAGAMALGAHGYERVTVDVDLLLTREGLTRLKDACLGRGYAENVPGSRGVRDTEHGVNIDVMIAGEFPADVLELIRAAKLPEDLGASLNPYVQDKYRELWHAAQIQDPE